MRSLVLFAFAGAASAQIAADLAVVNAKVWTVSAGRPLAEAVACRDGKILAVGSNADIRRLIGPETKTIDAGGRLVLPGFNDSHVHFYSGGAALAGVQLRDAKSELEFRERIRAFAAKLPKGRWIAGGEWDHENWTPPRLPSRQWIDAVTPDNPVFVTRLDGHMSLANSLALKLAGVTRDTPDPPGGTIVRDAGGEPTGVMKDAATGLVERVMPSPSEDEIVAALRAAMRYAAENGVTSVTDMSASPEILRVYQKLAARGELTVRVYAIQPLASWRREADVGVLAGFGNAKLKIGGLKGFADGSLGSTTALFFEPYLDAPQTSGLANQQMIPESKMLDNIRGADAAGLQVAIHAIGDKANQIVLGMYREVSSEHGDRDRRFRIEHAQHLRAIDIPRFGAQHVIASMQPYHAIDDGRWAENRIGPERAKGTYAFRTLLDTGAVLAFGSDWPVAPMKPLLGMYAAATRRTLDGKHPEGWVPEQKIKVEEAVRAYTMGSAYASFDEKIKGSVEPGKFADLVIVSDDILHIDPAAIANTKVVTTIFDGRILFQRE
jgi:predicted amidohydrolase YtcJ